MVLYPVRGSPFGIFFCLCNLIGYLCAALLKQDGGQVIGEF